MVGEFGLLQEKRDELEGEMCVQNECIMKSFGTLRSSEKKVARLWWPQPPKQGGKMREWGLCDVWKTQMERLNVDGVYWK